LQWLASGGGRAVPSPRSLPKRASEAEPGFSEALDDLRQELGLIDVKNRTAALALTPQLLTLLVDCADQPEICSAATHALESIARDDFLAVFLEMIQNGSLLQLLERRRRRYRLEHLEPEPQPKKESPLAARPKEDEQIREAVAKINDIAAKLPPEKRIPAKTAALMAELPVKEGYEAFEGSWGRVNQALEQAFTPRLGDALTHHLVHRMRHSNYEDKKTSSTWLNRELRKHKHALAFPGSGEAANLRAIIGGGYSHGKYRIERRGGEQEGTSPQELDQLLPQMRFIPAAPRQRATKEEMEQRTMAERELNRRGHRVEHNQVKD
jgi:hypothetical protein